MKKVLFMTISAQELFLIFTVLTLPILCILDIIRSRFPTTNAKCYGYLLY